MGHSPHAIDTSRRFVGTKETLIFGIANGGQCLSYSLLVSYITYFFVNIFNIDPAIVATMLFFQGIWDTVNDPIMGTVVDKTRTRLGKLRPYLLGMPLPLGVATIFLFAGPMLIHDPNPRSMAKIVFMVVTYFVWEFFYTICDVPFWGMAAAISPNPADRTRAITSARLIAGIIGGIPTVIIPILIDLSKNNILGADIKQVFFVAGLMSATIGMGLFFLSGVFVRERVIQSLDAPKMSDCFNCIAKNPPLRLIILSNVLGALGGIGGIFSTYYFIDVLGSASVGILIGIPGTVVSLVSFALIPKIKARFNNKQIIIGTKLFNDALSILMFLIALRRYTDIRFMIPLMMLRSTLSALFSGTGAVVPTEMIADSVDYMEWTTGQRSEGMSFSVLTFIGKFNNAIARSLGALLLSFIGYRTSHTNAIIPQTDAVKFRLFAMFTVVPTLLSMLSIIPMLFYDLVGDKQARMLAELAERRATLTAEASK